MISFSLSLSDSPARVLALALATPILLPLLSPDAQAETSKPGAWRGQSLTEFATEENQAMQWTIVNDGVMGGRSKGNLEISEEGIARFWGDLSLENNGGFSTMRTENVDFDLSKDLGLLLLVKGDGRTYEARLESSARFLTWKVSFAGEFETKAGEWHQVKIPFESFRGGFRGRDLPKAKLDPSQIGRLGILLADKQAGPFNLEVKWIRTYGKGQGNFQASSEKGKPENKQQTTAKSSSQEKSSDPTETKSKHPDKQLPITAPVVKKTSGERNLIDTAVEDGRFTPFKAALDAAELTTFFQWDNPLTLFVPTDDAFAKLPKGTLESLLQPENKTKLVAILSQHVAPGAATLADALWVVEVDPVKGGPLSVTFDEGMIRVNQATLIDADIRCSDGIIHAIDTVILPME